MNETIKTLLSRRSVRSFTDEEISDDDLELILKAGQFAPNGRGLQPVKVLVIKSREVYQKLSRLNAPGSTSDPFYHAKIVLVVISNKNTNTYMQDGSAALTNMANAAFSLGISSCWINRAKEMLETPYGRELLASLGLDPDEYIGVGNLILGHAKGDNPAPKPRKDHFYYVI